MDTNHELNGTITAAAIRAFLDHTSDLVFVKDRHSIYVDASESFIRMTGQTALHDIIGRTDFDIFENQELARRYVEDDRILLAGGKNLINYIEPITDDRGHSRYSSTSKYVLRDNAGEIVGILGISRDVTKEYVLQQRHQQELKYLFELPEDTYATLFMDIEDWRIIRHRRQMTGSYVLSVQENMSDFIENALNCLADPNDTETRRFYQELSKESLMVLCRRGIRQHTLEYLRRMPNGETIWVRVDINFLIDPGTGHQCAIWSLKNIDSAVQDTINLRYAAERDEMTGLLNRSVTMKTIQQVLLEYPNTAHALFFLDIDHFKVLNDTLGHQAGDQFLAAFATALKNCFRDSDVVGRVGGDEFFVLMKNVSTGHIVAEKAETVLRISRLLCSTYPIENLSVSIGVSLFPADGTTLSTLYAKADKALYQAKNSGKNQFRFAN